MGQYRRTEVIFLLSLTREQAIDLDSSQRDSCASFAATNENGGAASAEPQLPFIVRWHDVQRARLQVIRGKETTAVLQLRAGGLSEREVAKLLGRDHMTLRRRWRATVDDVLAQLGGESDEATAASTVAMCLKCGARPRARLEEVKGRIKGGWRIDAPERQASLCETCLPPELSSRITGKIAVAA